MRQIKEFKEIEPKEMRNKIAELKKELMKANVQISSGTTPPNPGKIKQIKKNIARLNTLIKQKEVKFK